MSFDKCIYPCNQLRFRTFSSSQKVPLCILPLTSLLSLTVMIFFIVRIPNSWRVKTEKSVAVFLKFLESSELGLFKIGVSCLESCLLPQAVQKIPRGNNVPLARVLWNGLGRSERISAHVQGELSGHSEASF